VDSEGALLSVPARLEGDDGHDSGSGLSIAVEHHGTTAGLSPNDGKIDDETEVVELWRCRLTSCSGEARISEEAECGMTDGVTSPAVWWRRGTTSRWCG
jgi:hypothetical protein